MAFLGSVIHFEILAVAKKISNHHFDHLWRPSVIRRALSGQGRHQNPGGRINADRYCPFNLQRLNCWMTRKKYPLMRGRTGGIRNDKNADTAKRVSGSLSGQFPIRKVGIFALARKSRACAEAYIIWSLRLPPSGGRGTGSGHGQIRDSVEILAGGPTAPERKTTLSVSEIN
jgi:hypothetical protein